MFKIVDLKNVINSKSNSRFKISSAPSQIIKTIENKSIFNTKNNVNNNYENITFSKFPNFDKNPQSTNVPVGYFSNATNIKPSRPDKFKVNIEKKASSINRKTSNKSLGTTEIITNNIQNEFISKKTHNLKNY